jgi:putative (di)nucleoside polyphosphate hydrolase
MRKGETPDEALYRELKEEIGLCPGDVKVLARTKGWLRYKLPKRLLRNNNTSFVGQKQKWFLLKMLADDDALAMDKSESPEFDAWRWVSYWYPLGQVVAFKRDVYRRAMKELVPDLARCATD